MNPVLEKAVKTHHLSKDDLILLLSDKTHQTDLFKAADTIRHQFVGDAVHLRGLIEFSNICKNNCLYCGIRRDNQLPKRYRLAPKEIISLAEKAVQQGFKTIVLQSGEDLFFTTHKICSILCEIKKMDVAITLSIGEKTADEYKAYKEAGADRFLLRIETTDKNLYHYLDPGMSWETRKQCLLDLKNAGYELGSGIMVGLPNQTIDSIADDLLFLKEIGIDMAGIGPFIPAQGTPLENEVGKDLYLALRTMALMRLLMPKINIPATTAMEALHPMGRLMALKAGANVVMPNITTEEYARLYQLYPGKESVDQSDIAQKILSIGRSIGLGYGTSKQFKKI